MSEVIQRKCKNVISKLQRRIDNEGHQIIPLLTELWRRIENSSSVGGAGDNILDLRKIQVRVDKFEYSGVMELVSDVQLMLKCGMQYHGFSYEVRSEARKVHDLFFDILNVAFSDTDFREARNSMSFSASVATPATGPSSRQAPAGPSKRQKSVRDVDSDNSPFQKPQSRAPIHTVESTKRKDREKSAPKSGSGSAGPLSPTGLGRSIKSPGSISGAKDTGSSQQSSTQGWAALSPQQGNNSGGSVGWANPVKRMRTDAGRRRPSHL
ncbi:UNVERIFIED_CONTAM: ATP-dependent helicase BRM [Sesamum radiatum]|uniref:ATP-dependent helicase BRM n=1 Tax=Sesamum radiatum TaxID=300843 RepID=A0AAW2VHM4_SESRA